ncbi:MAG: ABC transporter permease [Candidatus Latescibacterota bacterium]
MHSIILRELHDALKGFRFITLLILSIILFTISGLLFASRYQEARQEYTRRITFIHSVKSTRTSAALREPSPFLFLAEGGDRLRVREYWISPGGKIEPSGNPSPPENAAMPDVPELDWAFIIKVVFSLYALILGYAAVSGERESGTLRMLASYSHTRPKILIAKFCTIFIVLCIPLILGMTINLGIIGGSIPEAVSLSSVTRYLIMLFTTAAYLSLFIFLSLLISSSVRESSVSLLILLMLWVACTVTPDFSGVFANKLYTGRSEYALAKALINSERREVYRNLRSSFQRRIDRGELKTIEEIREAFASEAAAINETILHNSQAYRQFLDRRSDTARMLSKIAPMALFQYAAEAAAGTGHSRERRFAQDMIRHSWEYDRYIEEKLGKVVPELEFGQITVRLDGKMVNVKLPQPSEYNGDKSGLPVFRESDSSLRNILRDMLFDLSGLLFWNLALAAGAFLAFNRADVR